ncbi:MAG: adenylate/guanylate cyclase domain-containing protein, partial [Anaerolineales bacterium]|nr:adenylate/guanylate cyclase domain-containing protein [Anaerolineales bacterium]
MSFPSGTVTFLFTDIEGSTALLRELGDGYTVLLADQRRILRESFKRWGGREVDTQGDAFFVSFPRAADAIGAVIAAQKSLQTHVWPGGVELKVRMGVHTGEPEVADDGYVGMDVHRAARLAHAGHGGQVLLSETTEALVRDELPQAASLKDLGEFKLKDMPRYEHIYQLVVDGLPSGFPPLAAEALARNNLPRHLTTFIGRERELERVRELLQSGRIVTLVGPGGVGKTRLSIQAAMEASPNYAHGVRLVELAALTDPDLVPQLIAQSLDLREKGGEALLDSVVEYLQPRHLLLILDNCEHLIHACAQFAAAVLAACPQVSILATSREVLGVAGESIYSVPSLATADPQGRPGPEALLEVESIRLFRERAAAASSGFELNEENAQAVAQICRRLDGIPLAIELAAARVRVLSPQQIDERLRGSFSLLAGGDRMALPRQQTLRATIDWSHELLTEPEKVLFRRLAVFVGGWTLEAAEEICTRENLSFADSLDQAEVLDLLSNLVDKSLVIKTEHAGTARYRWLETVSRYARERLIESKEVEGLSRYHLEWFLREAEEGEDHFEGPDQPRWLRWLQTEYGNLRAALAWSQRQADSVEFGLRLAVALISYWNVIGNLSEGREQLAALISQSEASAPQLLLARALQGEAILAYLQSDYPATQALYERSLAIYKTTGPEGLPGMADAYIGLGNVATEVGDY